MNAWDGAIVAVVGMLGGVLLVVLLQLVGAVRATRKLLEELTPELKKAAQETATLTHHLNTFAAPIATQGEGAARFLAALDRLALTVDKMNRVAQTAGMVAAVVAPAITAAIGAVRQANTTAASPCSRDDEDPAANDNAKAEAPTSRDV